MRNRDRSIGTVLAVFCALIAATMAVPAAAQVAASEDDVRRYIFGMPAAPDEAWELAQGGRLYDSWWLVVQRDYPETTHPAYPSDGAYPGTSSWRCVECHGWDYRGIDGAFGEGPHRTGIKGIDGKVGADPAVIVAILRDDIHGYTPELIPDEAALLLARFVSAGQHDITAVFDGPDDIVKGDPVRGRRIFQNVCATCHDYDGRAEITGEEPWLRTIGAVARRSPWQALHKIRNGQPSADMPALRAFDMQASLDVLAYARTLPVEVGE
jgi:mono/diheme cytochrome c family protein